MANLSALLGEPAREIARRSGRVLGGAYVNDDLRRAHVQPSRCDSKTQRISSGHGARKINPSFCVILFHQQLCH